MSLIGRYSTIEILQGLHNALQIKCLCPNIVCMPTHLALPPPTQRDFTGDTMFFSCTMYMCFLCLGFSPFRLSSPPLFTRLPTPTGSPLWHAGLGGSYLPMTSMWCTNLDIPQTDGHVLLHFSCTTSKKLAVATLVFTPASLCPHT